MKIELNQTTLPDYDGAKVFILVDHKHFTSWEKAIFNKEKGTFVTCVLPGSEIVVEERLRVKEWYYYSNQPSALDPED